MVVSAETTVDERAMNATLDRAAMSKLDYASIDNSRSVIAAMDDDDDVDEHERFIDGEIFRDHQDLRRFRPWYVSSLTSLGDEPTSLQSKSTKSKSTVSQSYAALKEKRAWDLSISPAKSLPMQAFMLYMSGSGVQIFSMGIVFMLLSSPFKNVVGIHKGECWIVQCP